MNEPKYDQEIIHAEDHGSPERAASEDDIRGHDFSIDHADLPKGYFRSVTFLGSMFAIGLSLACGVGGFALAAPILAIINADIGPDPNLTWVALTYTLTTGVCLVIVGRVTDLFGRRWFMTAGTALGLIGSIVCATAPNINALIAGETLIGIGGSTQISFAFTINELVPFKWRFLANGYVYCWGLIMSGLAPLISYAFVYKSGVGWRGVYYLLISLNGAALLSWFFFYHPPTFEMKHGEGRKWRFIKQFDYVGTLMVALGLLLFFMGLSWGGVLYAWDSAHVITTIVVGAMLLIAFGLYEAFMPLKEPLLPLRAVSDLRLISAIVVWSLGSGIYYAFAIIWPTMLTVLYADKHSDLMWPGYAALALNAGISFGEILGACLAKKWIHWMIRFCFFAGCALLAAVASATPDTPGRAIALMFIGTTLIGMVELLASTMSSILVKDQREIGTVIGFAGSVRSTISTICATVYTVVLTNRLGTEIAKQVPSALVAAGLPASSVAGYLAGLTSGNATALAAVPGLTSEISAIGLEAYKNANMSAYRTVFYSTIAFSGVGIILSIFLLNIDHMLTGQVSATLHVKGEEIVGGSPQKSKAAEHYA